VAIRLKLGGQLAAHGAVWPRGGIPRWRLYRTFAEFAATTPAHARRRADPWPTGSTCRKPHLAAMRVRDQPLPPDARVCWQIYLRRRRSRFRSASLPRGVHLGRRARCDLDSPPLLLSRTVTVLPTRTAAAQFRCTALLGSHFRLHESRNSMRGGEVGNSTLGPCLGDIGCTRGGSSRSCLLRVALAALAPCSARRPESGGRPASSQMLLLD